MKDSLTYQQVQIALESNDYLLLRNCYGQTFAVNCKIRKLKSEIENTSKFDLTQKCNYVSFKPISFQEYISRKLPFLA